MSANSANREARQANVAPGPSDEVRAEFAQAMWLLADELEAAAHNVRPIERHHPGPDLHDRPTPDYARAIKAVAATCRTFGLPFVLAENPTMRVAAYHQPADLLQDPIVSRALQVVGDLSHRERNAALEGLYQEHVSELARRFIYPATLITTDRSANIFFSPASVGTGEFDEYLHATGRYPTNARPVEGVLVWHQSGYTFVTPGRSWMNVWPKGLRVVELNGGMQVVGATMHDVTIDQLMLAANARPHVALIGTSSGHMIHPLRAKQMQAEQDARDAASARSIR